MNTAETAAMPSSISRGILCFLVLFGGACVRLTPGRILYNGADRCITEVEGVSGVKQLSIRPCEGGAGQQFFGEWSNRPGTMLLIHNRCAQLPEDAMRRGTVVQTGACDSSDGQRFIYKEVGRTEIVPAMELRDYRGADCLGATTQDPSVRLAECGTTSTRWHLLAGQSATTLPPPPSAPRWNWTFIHDNTGGSLATKRLLNLQAVDESLFETGFRWYVRKDGSEWREYAHQAAKAGARTLLSAAIEEPQLNVRYEMKVAAYNQAGSAESSVVQFVASVPAQPTNLRSDNTAQHNIYLCWDDNSYNEDGFIIRYELGEKRISKNDQTDNISNLQEDTQYSFSIYAYNEWGRSPETRVSIRTAPPSDPSPADIAVGDARIDPALPLPGQAIRVSWEECNKGGSATGSYKTKLYLDRREIESLDHNDLLPSQCVLVNVMHPGVSTGGSHRFRIVADEEGKVIESTRYNNATEIGF